MQRYIGSVIIVVYEQTVLGVGQTPHIYWVLTGVSRGLSKIEHGKLCSIFFSTNERKTKQMDSEEKESAG